MNKAFNQFEIRTDIVVIGHNPEMADFSNRNGAIHGYAAYIEASNDYGDTRQLFIDSSRCEADVVEKVLIPFESGHLVSLADFVTLAEAQVLIPFESGHLVSHNTGQRTS